MSRHLLVCVLVLICATSVLAGFSFTIYADWGIKSTWASTLAEVSEKHDSQFMAAIGDNFYREHGAHPTRMGVRSVHDPKWKRIFENVYTQPFFQKMWYVVAGNHDYNGNVHAQVKYTQLSKRWHFPSKYYKFSKEFGNITMDFFMLDTVPLYYPLPKLNQTFGIQKKDMAQLTWLDNALKASNATWKIVMGHHQIHTAHGSVPFMRTHVAPLLEKHKVSAYINGHIHSVMHVEQTLPYITLGNAAFQRPVTKGRAAFVYPTPEEFKTSCGGGACRGFGIFTINDKKSAEILYYNRGGQLLKTFPIHNRN